MTFDSAALTYDAQFTDGLPGRWLREQVRAYFPFQSGQSVLELGCGTGEDAIYLADHGMTVTATDASTMMLTVARQKANGRDIDFQRLDLNDLTRTGLTIYDGVLANFGVLNCVDDRRRLAAFLADHTRPGARLILVIMAPLCAWEIGWHLLHGKPREAFRRLRPEEMAHAGGDEMLPVWYPTPGRLRREFAPAFRHHRTRGIGTLLPPSYLAHLIERYPATFARIARLDRLMTRLPHLSDHYLIELERR
jgi:SAM-dependent methyltransferase